MKDTYLTLSEAAQEILFKEKNSKFYGYAFPVTAEEMVKSHLEVLRKKHFGAGHFCYAYQLGTEKVAFRANDDGEPANTAGMPIYGQIQSFGLTNVLVVVVRFFGGVKLGVGGLISAYRTAAQLVLETAPVIEKTIHVHFAVSFEYKDMNKVMRLIKEKHLEIVSQQMDERCRIEIATRKKNADSLPEIFAPLYEIQLERIEKF